jgi:dihydrofolate synthase/folylpolyglutamate synthase
MTYQETLAYLYGLGRFGIKPGLERISALLENLGNPHLGLKAVQIAGTNGKGSTAAFISSILCQQGEKVGLFTSPHLISFTERIRVDGRPIDEDDVIKLAAVVMEAAPVDATFFEIVTAMAILHFVEQKVSIAVMEAGMGGANDATNVVDGSLAIITPISLDHCEYLGDSIPAIAADKGGIIRRGRPVVLAPQPDAAMDVLLARCSELGASCHIFGRDFSADMDRGVISYHGIKLDLSALKPGLNGRYQRINAGVAVAAAELLDTMGHPTSEDSLRNGVAKASWPGRMELMGEEPRFLLDGAHNPAGAAALADALEELVYRRLFLVAGLMGDKDLNGILNPLLSKTEEVFAVAPAMDRALPATALADYCKSRGVPAVAAGAVAAGLEQAAAKSGSGDLILVSGSLFTVGEARAHLLARCFEPFRG